MAASVELSQQKIAHALRHFVICGALWAVYSPNATVAGSIYAGFALHIGLSEAQIAFLVSLASLAGATELVSFYFSQRARNKLLFILALGHLEILAASATVLMALAGPQYRFLGVCVLMVSAYLLGHTVSPLFSSWLSNVIPEEVRATYTGRRMFIVTVVSTLYLYAASQVIDHAEGISGFYVVFTIGCIAGLLGYWILAVTPMPRLAVQQAAGFTRSLLQPWRDRRFATLALMLCSWTIATSLAGPFYGVYMLKYLHLSYSHVAVYTNVALLCMLLGYLAAGPIAQRYGSKPVAQLLIIPGMLAPLLWVFATPDAYRWLIPIASVGSGLSVSSLSVALGSLLYKIVPRGVENSAHFANWTGLSATAAAVGPFIGGALRSRLPDHLVLLGLQLTPLQVIFGLSGVCFLLPLAVATFIVEPEATSPRYLLGQFRGNLLSFAWNFARYQVARDDETRAEALRQLGRSGTPLAVEPLVRALEHVSPQVRAEAAKGLGAGGFEEAVQPLMETLEDTQSDIRPEAAEALGKIGHGAAADALLRALEDEDPRVRASAALALGEIGDERAAQALIAALQRPFDRTLFPTLVEAATRRGDLRLVAPIMRGLPHLQQPVIRMQVLNGVCRVLGEKRHFYRMATAEPLQRAGMSEPMMARIVRLLSRAKVADGELREELRAAAQAAAQALATDELDSFAEQCRRLAELTRKQAAAPPVAAHAADAIIQYLDTLPAELAASEGVVFLVIALTALARSWAGQHPGDR